MALGWGDNAWGEYAWGGTVGITGNQTAAAIGEAAPVLTIPISGVSASGAVGIVTQSQEAAEIGDLATASVGTVEASVTVAITGVGAVGLIGFGWGADTWGSNVWGGYSVGFGNGYGITGVAATGAVGSVTSGGVDVGLTGVSASGAVGTVIQSADKALTGVTTAGDIGTVGRTNTVDVTGNIAYGQVAQPVVPLNSNQADAYVGTVSVAERTIALTGVSSSGTVNTMGVPRSLGLTGNSATGSVGDVTAVYWKLISDKQSTVWQNINTS